MRNDIELLKKYESWFHSAIECDYIRALWDSDMKILVPIYEKWTNSKFDGNSKCPKCKLDFMKKLGQLYFNNKEKMELEDGKNIEQGSKGKGEICSRVNSKRKQSKGSSTRTDE